MLNKIAYIILCHHNEKQIKKLIQNLLYKEHIDVYIHVDKKNPTLKNNLIKVYGQHQSVYIIPDSINVNWSGFSQVDATLLSFEYIMKNERRYDFITLLSGQDYPLRSSIEILSFLRKNMGKNFIEYEDIGTYEWRINRYNFFTENVNTRSFPLKVFRKFSILFQKIFNIKRKKNHTKLYKGSGWFTLTEDVVKYILEEVSIQNLRPKYKYTSCADEHFFQNILLNSEFEDTIINDNLRYIIWEHGASSPKTYTLAEVETIKEDLKENWLWIRKVIIK